MSTLAQSTPSRKMRTAQIFVLILLALVAIVPFTVRLYPLYPYNGKIFTQDSPSSSSRAMKKEIESLEKDMVSLEKQFLVLSDEMTLLTKQDLTHNNKVDMIKTQQSNNQEDPKNDDEEEEEEEGGKVQVDRFAQFTERVPKKWWVRKDLFESTQSNNPLLLGFSWLRKGKDNYLGAIIPFDLSVNHLQLVERAPGSPYSDLTVNEDFLPVVLQSDIAFRWRSRARPESSPQDGVKTTAYQIIARQAYSENDDGSATILWDSGKVNVLNGLPDVVIYNEDKIEIGSVIEWKVIVWDSSQPEGKSTSSDWSKFAVGPSQSEWQGRWISHPIDIESWDETDASAFWIPTSLNGTLNQRVACRNWEKRSQLPLFRTQLPALDTQEDDGIATALLVVSGLGSFRASFDGKPLSSSGPLDPPLTDFAQRVSYRGFDVTPYLTGDGAKIPHVVGISMGSGWWDHRPIGGSFIRLFFFPHGAVTCVAQLYVTYKSGRTEVVIPTGYESSGWQVAKGHLRESSLFTGEYIDLRSKAEFDGWDTAQKWKELYSDPIDSGNIHTFVLPERYNSDTTIEKWREHLHVKSKAAANDKNGPPMPLHKLAPIGRLIPHESPPVLPMEKIYPDEILDLGGGRWMIDFGKGFSGMLRFENGLPKPIVPDEGYPRGHEVNTLAEDESFITVVYGERLEMYTHDINLPLVAGMGLHDGGPRHKAKKRGDAEARGGPCYPKDHVKAGSLLQRDVYILPKSDDGKGSFSDARQSHFTTHAFRFAEICCTEAPPVDVTALAYRSSFKEWGDFSSSNVRINGGYELVKNAMNANLLGVQSDCPHREKIQYGGDIIADSPSALHFYDMSAFYRKVVLDWSDQQWDNGAYAGTSYWLMLNDQTGIGYGSGETVWASAPVVMTVRHMQHYGDLTFLERTLDKHFRWLKFLLGHFDEGMKNKNYHEELKGYWKSGSGLGDWLSFRQRDTWLTHEGFYMASARSIAYIAKKLGTKGSELNLALEVSKLVKDRIARLYDKNKQGFQPPDSRAKDLTPGQEMGLFSRIVPGDRRCNVLRHYFTKAGHTWPGSAEMSFLGHIDEETKQSMINSGEVTKRGKQDAMGWSQWHGFSEGIFAIRYALKTLSENGYHNVALDKANGFGVGTWEYMLSHNATTHWESWWRSEDLYSHNHPMLGASAEWMVSAVAGVELEPTTTGGREVLFWPRFPNSANTLEYAGATQGTRRGDFSIAWEFLNLPQDKTMYDSATVQIHIRCYVPPDGKAVLRLPEYSDGEGVDSTLKKALVFPDIDETKLLSSGECTSRRKSKQHGFDYNWEFDEETKLWGKFNRKKSIGTPCRHFLFQSFLSSVEWDKPITAFGSSDNGLEVILAPGLYDIVVNGWQLQPEVKGDTNQWRIGDRKEYYLSEDIGPYCADTDSFDWNIGDASHLI